MKLDVHLVVADFVRPEFDKSRLQISGITARYTFHGSRALPGRWSFLAAEVEVPDLSGLDAEGMSVVVAIRSGVDDSTPLLPGDIPIVELWLDEKQQAIALRYVPAQNLVSHAEAGHFGFTLHRRHSFGFQPA